MNPLGSLPQAGALPGSALTAVRSVAAATDSPGLLGRQLLPKPPGVSAAGLSHRAPTPAEPRIPSATSAPAQPRRSWWRWWGRRRRGQLNLAAVRVVRNELAGEDLLLMPRPSPATRGLTLGAERSGRRAAGGGWRGWLAHWAAWVRRNRAGVPMP